MYWAMDSVITQYFIGIVITASGGKTRVADGPLFDGGW
jgi:hypothetical protein